MNAPKHTPGPFAVDDVVSGALHDIILAREIPAAGSPILLASCFYDEEGRVSPGSISKREAHANATLFAAAPELAEALHEFTKFVLSDELQDAERCLQRFVALKRRARVALEKAGWAK